jgi:hypothetical protein
MSAPPVPVIVGEIDEHYEHLLTLDNRQGLTPDAILTDASDPASPLHGCFEWDDTLAAQKYRRIQASAVLHRYRLIRTGPTGQATQVRAWVYLPSQRRHRHVDDVVRDAGLSQEVLGQMRRDLRSFIARYEHWRTLVPSAGSAIERIGEIASALDL